MRDDIDTRLLDYWLTDREQTDAIPIRPLPDRIRSVLRRYWLPVDVREEYVELLYKLFADELPRWFYRTKRDLDKAYQTIDELRNQILLEEDIRAETREWAKDTLRNRYNRLLGVDKL